MSSVCCVHTLIKQLAISQVTGSSRDLPMFRLSMSVVVIPGIGGETAIEAGSDKLAVFTGEDEFYHQWPGDNTLY